MTVAAAEGGTRCASMVLAPPLMRLLPSLSYTL
jgi:hypothetical protein